MIGQIISHYKILDKLGKGGMGIVYKAEDLKLGRIIVLKILPEEFAKDDESKQRFVSEAKAASSLQHNNICTIHEIDETESGQLFICMDFYEGETLEQKIKKGPINTEDTVNYMIQIADGLSQAHLNNIIHRDIKPGNIFITNDGVVKILDFGLAKNENYSQLTKPGATFGTISYMSPEHSIGEDVDSRTDIWSLGVVLYEMLTGQRPFKSDHDQAVIYSILNEEPKSNPLIPVEFEKAISKLLSKDKQKRYSNLNDLIIDLKKISGIEYSKSKYFLQSNKKTFQISFIILILLSVFSLLYINITTEKPQITKRSISILAFENQTGDTSYNYLNVAVPNLLITNLEQSKLFNITSWERLRDLLKQSGVSEVYNISKEQGFRLCEIDNVNTIVFGSITKAGNYFVIDVKLLDVASKKLINSVSAKGEGIESILNSQIDEISKNIISNIAVIKSDEALPIPIIELTTNSLEAYNYYLRGNDGFTTLAWESGARNYLKAIEIDSNFAMAYNNLAVCYSYLNKIDEMKFAIKKALFLSKNISSKEKLFVEGQYEILITKNYQKAFNLYNKLSVEFPKDKIILMYKAFCVNRLFSSEEAVKIHKEILLLDPTFGNSLNSIGYHYLLNNNTDSAKIYFDKQLEAFPQAANSFDALGDYCLITGDWKTAKQYYERTISIEENFSSTEIKIAYLFALQDDFKTSKNIIKQKVEAETGLDKGIALTWLAYYEYLTKSYQESFELQKLARQVMAEENNANHILINNYLTAWLYLDKNDFENSEKYFDVFLSYLDKGVRKKSEILIFDSYKNLRRNKLDSIGSNIIKVSELIKNFSHSEQRLYKKRFESLSNYLEGELLLIQNMPMKALDNSKSFSPKFNLNFNEKMIIDNIFYEKDIRARCFIKMNQIKNAIKEYEKLLYGKKDRKNTWINNPIYHYRLAKLYEEQKIFSKALKEYKIFLNICKNGDASESSITDCKNKIIKLSKFQKIKNE